jgi:hypothetical protein
MMSKFLKKGWHYIPEIITPNEAIEIKYKNLCGAVHDLNSLEGHWDKERGRVLTCYAPPSCTYIVPKIQKILEPLVGEELLPTYWFSTTYHNRGWMSCHTDRPSCEISVTMNICGDAPWPIKLKDKEGNKQSFVTPPGHGVAYLGTEVPHWRSPLRTHKNDRFMQLFCHFVRKNGPYANYAFDRNKKCYNLLVGNRR